MANKKTILWVEDDPFQIDGYIFYLRDKGFNVEIAQNLSDAKTIITNSLIDLIILDVMLPPGDESEVFNTKAGFESGLSLGRWIKENYSDIPIIGFTAKTDERVKEWFNRYGIGYIRKYETSNIEKTANQILALVGLGSNIPKTFIVHGQDRETKLDLKNFLQNTLKLGEPIILHEQPSLGRTIIEKFEDITDDVDLVFVLLTPDDKILGSGSNEIKRRSRQNVIFEMGFFMAKLQRKTGRVLLLYKGELELPSDLSGVVYIDISNGIDKAGEEIRKELVGFI